MMYSSGIMHLIRMVKGEYKKVLSWIPAAKSVFFYSMVDQLKGQETSPTSHLGWLQAGRISSCKYSTYIFTFIHITSTSCPCHMIDLLKDCITEKSMMYNIQVYLVRVKHANDFLEMGDRDHKAM